MTPSKDAIEERIETSRAELHETLEELGAKLAPNQIVGEIMTVAKNQVSAVGADMGRRVAENPWPLLLIGAGVTLLVLNNRNREQDSGGEYARLEAARMRTPRLEHEGEEEYGARMHQAHAEALGLKQHAEEAIEQFRSRVRSAVSFVDSEARQMRARMRRGYEQGIQFASEQAVHVREAAMVAGDQTKRLYEDNPLVVGALAMAAGAAIGSATPLSETERRGLTGIANKASDMGAGLLKDAGRAVADARVGVH
jgi:ElaB/YqjD/DUF883 family membrane-anchored ribosome-binding protein